MADPPSYEESTSGEQTHVSDTKDSKEPRHFSIWQEVSASRSQHVAAVVAKLVPLLQGRARSGLSKSTLLLLPSNQECSRKGQLVGFPDDDAPILVQLEDQQDTLEFWTQNEAIALLQRQMLAAISDVAQATDSMVQQSLAHKTSKPASKPSIFGRKQSRVQDREAASTSSKPPVTVAVQLHEAHFRSENEYGLFETKTGRCISVTVDVG